MLISKFIIIYFILIIFCLFISRIATSERVYVPNPVICVHMNRNKFDLPYPELG